MNEYIDGVATPEGTMDILSKAELERLQGSGQGGLHDLFRRCALAVLNTGSNVDDAKLILERFHDFQIRLVQRDRGLKLEMSNAPATAFVDGKMIRGIKEHLFSVLRDIVYVHNEIQESPRFDLQTSQGITDAIFHILRNARAFDTLRPANLVVCWGGHSIGREEYDYTKEVGYEMGLRGLDICTGCGPGAMKGPMKGATIGHAKQRIGSGLYVGITEPGIIAAEPPNPIVNKLVILPDIEKRLEAFVRLGHGVVVFPGGVGTAEEILYLLGILLHPDNANQPFPVIFTGPRAAEPYFEQIDAFIGTTLGRKAQQRYKIIIDNPQGVAREMRTGLEAVGAYREAHLDACFFNWQLKVDPIFQQPFTPTHQTMAALALHGGTKPHQMAANLRRCFSGIVAGNVKEEGIRAIEELGPFQIHGDRAIMEPLDRLLAAFVDQQRMKLPTTEYVPCYEVVAR
jgi:pyrimidine/purine-5'-nucleotide nucleosidase